MRAPHAISVLALSALSLVACNTPSQAQLDGFVAGSVHPGMLASQAEIALDAKGFRCFRINGEPADECTRMSATQVIATCIQRVTIRYDQAAAHVSKVAVSPIRCTSL